jgi:hypothetical protein
MNDVGMSVYALTLNRSVTWVSLIENRVSSIHDRLVTYSSASPSKSSQDYTEEVGVIVDPQACKGHPEMTRSYKTLGLV